MVIDLYLPLFLFIIIWTSPIISTGVGTLLLGAGSKRGQSATGRQIALGSLLLLVAGVCSGYMASWGELGVTVARVSAQIAVLISLIIGIGFSLTMKRWRKVIGGLALIVWGIQSAALPYGYLLSDEVATRRNGDAIVKALEDYRKDQGDYPYTLKQLVPTYLEVIPPTLVVTSGPEGGWDYDIKVIARDKFELSFHYFPEVTLNGPDVCTYTSRKPEWNCGLRKVPSVFW